jgi:hypothetical protein
MELEPVMGGSDPETPIDRQSGSHEEAGAWFELPPAPQRPRSLPEGTPELGRRSERSADPRITPKKPPSQRDYSSTAARPRPPS